MKTHGLQPQHGDTKGKWQPHNSSYAVDPLRAALMETGFKPRTSGLVTSQSANEALANAARAIVGTGVER